MKKLLLLMALSSLIVPLGVSADDTDGTSNEQRPMMEKREELKAMHMDMKADIKDNRIQAEENRKAYREENQELIEEVKASLTEEQKDDLEELRETFKSDIEELREELRNAETDEEKAEILAEMDALAEANLENIKEILGDNEQALELFTTRKDVWEDNQELREENREIRHDYREVRRETVEKYRKAFVERLEDKLDSIPDEKLEEIIEKIDSMIEKYENNETISDERKEAMLSALIALKEIVEEKLEGDDVEDEVLETVEDLID